MSLKEVITQIRKLDSDAFQGKTPEKSLYSVIYRRERKREKLQKTSAFIIERRYGATLYKLNPQFNTSEAGEQIA